jgi:transcription elongation factor GreB
VPVDPSKQPNRDQVFFGATVRYQRADAALVETVTIVGIDEVDPAAGRISWIAPVARALLKAREGDIVTVRTPAGVEELEILAIDYPDA